MNREPTNVPTVPVDAAELDFEQAFAADPQSAMVEVQCRLLDPQPSVLLQTLVTAAGKSWRERPSTPQQFLDVHRATDLREAIQILTRVGLFAAHKARRLERAELRWAIGRVINVPVLLRAVANALADESVDPLAALDAYIAGREIALADHTNGVVVPPPAEPSLESLADALLPYAGVFFEAVRDLRAPEKPASDTTTAVSRASTTLATVCPRGLPLAATAQVVKRVLTRASLHILRKEPLPRAGAIDPTAPLPTAEVLAEVTRGAAAWLATVTGVVPQAFDIVHGSHGGETDIDLATRLKTTTRGIARSKDRIRQHLESLT